MPRKTAEPQTMVSIRCSLYLRLAIKRVARKRSAKFDRTTTVKDIILSNVFRDEEVMREYRSIKAGAPKNRK